MAVTRVPKRVLSIVMIPLLLLGALLSWALASPVGASPDDGYHMASIWCGTGLKEGICEPGETPQERRVPAQLQDSADCFAYDPDASASCPWLPSDVLVSTQRGNFDASYPPVFYAAMSVFVGSDIAGSVVAMRAVNALFFVGFVTALFLLLPRGRRGPLTWGTAVTIIPLGMFIIPSVNPSSWAILSGATLWVALTGYFAAVGLPRRIAFGSLAVVAAVLGAGSRSDAAVYAGIAVLVAVVLNFEWTRRFALRAILPFAVILIALAFFFLSGQSSVIDPSTGPGPQGDTISLLLANVVLLPQLWVGSLGTTGLGWLDTWMPGTVWVSMLAAFFGLLFWGLRKMSRRKAVALAIVFGSLVVIPLYILVKDQVMVGAGVQPRYIFPLVIMLAGVALWGLRRDDLRLSRLQLWIVAILIVVANAVALHTNIRRYVTGAEVRSANLNAGIEWWWEIPISPMAVWLAGSVMFAGAVAGLVIVSTRSKRLADAVPGIRVDEPGPVPGEALRPAEPAR